MAQGQQKANKNKSGKKKPITKRQRTACKKKTVAKKYKDEASKKINAEIERTTSGKAARGGQHFELSAVSEQSKEVCAELRKESAKSKKQLRAKRAVEKAEAVARKAEENSR